MALNTKMLVLYAVTSVVILCVAGAWLTVKSQQDQLGELGRELVNQLKHIDFAVSGFLSEVDSDVAALAANELVRTREDEDFTSFLEADEDVFVYHVGTAEQNIISVFSVFRATHPYVNSVYMGRENGTFVRSHPRARPTRYDPRTRPWYILAKDNPGRVMRTEAYSSVTTPDVNIGVVTALVDDSDRVYGVVGTDVTLADLTQYLSGVEVGYHGQMLLVDENGTVLASNDEALRFHSVAGLVGGKAPQLMESSEGILQFSADNTSSYLFYYTSPGLGWKIATVVPAEDIREAIWSEVLPVLTGLVLALALLSVLTFVGMSLTVVRPLTQLNRVVLTITRTGDLSQRVAIKTKDEIGSLATSFNQMILTLRDKEVALKKSEEELGRHRDHLEELVQDRTEELASAITRLTSLNRLSRDLAAVVDLEELLPTIAHQVADALVVDCCAVYLVDEDTGRPQAKAVHGQAAGCWGSPESLPAEQVVCKASASGTLQYVPDLGPSAGATGEHTIRAVMASPLASPSAGGMGAIGVGSVHAEAFGPDQQQMLETMSHQIAVAIENVRLFAETERHAAELATLHEVGKEITSTLELDAMLQTIVDDAVSMVRADKSLILLVDAVKGALTKAVGHGYSHDQLDAQSFDEFRQGISGAVLREKVPSLSADIRADERNRGIALAKALASGDRSAAIAPLVVGEEAIGTLTVINSLHSGVFTPADLRLITMLASQAAIAIQNARLYEAAQQADRLKSAFLASMSHELRTPLNSIIGFTGILLQGLVGPLSDEQAKQLRMVMGSARHLLELINDVLDISKIEADQLEIASELLDVRQSIEKALQTVRPLADKKGLPLSASIAPEVGQLLGDRRRVEQVLINLLNNAVKFTETGEVRIESLVCDDWLVTRIVDTGIGIKPDDLNTLFKPFRQIDTGTARRHEGTGLGLAICKRLVEKMGGEIWAESEWGVGSVFAVRLPLSGPVEEESPTLDENR